MLWLALHLPWLPLEALLVARSPADAGGARCVVEQRVVQVADRAARQAGIVPGMAAATAQALLPGLEPLQRERAREAAFIHLLALSLSRYTPHLVVGAEGVLLEVAGSLRLFGGLRSLASQLRQTLKTCGAHAHIGMAPTPGAALLFAQVRGAGGQPGRARQLAQAQPLLDGLPLPAVLSALQATPRLVELMQGIGCQRVAEVRALPRTGLQRRGGGALLQALDRAYGEAPDPQRWFEPPLEFAAELELVHRADDAAMLAFAAQRLVQALAGWLTRQWLAVASLSLWLQHETTGRHALPPTRLRIELGQASRDAAQIGLLLRERLQRCELPAPVYGLKLELDEAVALAGHESGLPFGTDRSGSGWSDPRQDAQDFRALLDRLSARLGPERVQRLVLQQDHRPERAAIAVPAVSRETSDRSMPAATALPSRPAWLLPEPLRLAEQGGRPVHGGPLVLRTRPERIEAGWFDGALACRDYHVAEGSDHRLRWVFRERRGDGEPQWFLHGLFG
jgi:protein ImuB